MASDKKEAENRLRVQTKPVPAEYDIIIDRGILPELGGLIKPVLPSSRVVVISDENVAPLYMERILKSFKNENIECLETVTIPAGEKSKCFQVFEDVSNQLLKARIDRRTTIIALGGGVVGDLSGFVAASLLRGIPFIQVPTSLLAQVDSSVGGKTGINTAHGKNLVGAFYQPLMVVIDIETLHTLPEREFKSGYAEVVKYGLINDFSFFEYLEGKTKEILSLDAETLKYIIRTCCLSKANIVSQDEKEQGVRALLNLGHTFGHALEAEAKYDNRILHGEAVAIGTLMVFELSAHLGLCPEDDGARIKEHFKVIKLPLKTDYQFKETDLLHHIKKDKKNQNEKIRFILVKGIGKAFQANDVAVENIKYCMKNYI